MNRRGAAALLSLGLLSLPGLARAASADPGRWLIDHLAVDGAAIVGWRAGWVDPQHDGFLAIGGGGEVNLGLEFGGGYAILAGGRAFYGTSTAADAGVSSLPYLEASGQLGAQLRIADWVRLGVGASVGRILRGTVQSDGVLQTDDVALLAGGFLRCGVDWLPRQNANLLRAFSLWLRLDLTGHLLLGPDGGSSSLPRSSMALGLGLGLRL